MRIAVAGFAHESNSFSSQPTTLGDFGVNEGRDMLNVYADTFHEIAGYIAASAEFGYELYPLFAAAATPAGPLTAEAYESWTARLLTELKAAPALDGILLALHGALVAARFPPIKLAISRLGIFPNTRRPRVLWAGLTGELEALSELQSAVDDMVGRLELPKEQRPFSPHLTLGRVRRETSESQLRKIGEIIADAAPPSAEPWTANTVNLMRTELDPVGSRHYLVGTAAIGGG